MMQGGLIAGPGSNIPMTLKTLRVVEPGLSVVSINGGGPEYLISQSWFRKNPRVPVGPPPEARDWTQTRNQRRDQT